MSDPVSGERYEHWKGGTYEVVARGFIEATGDACVVYRSENTGVVWVRPLSNFVGLVKDESGAGLPAGRRFRFIGLAKSKPEGSE